MYQFERFNFKSRTGKTEGLPRTGAGKKLSCRPSPACEEVFIQLAVNKWVIRPRPTAPRPSTMWQRLLAAQQKRRGGYRQLDQHHQKDWEEAGCGWSNKKGRLAGAAPIKNGTWASGQPNTWLYFKKKMDVSNLIHFSRGMPAQHSTVLC